MDDEYELSIIAPIFNVENWIDQCLDSIVNLKDIDYEIILIDDGSSDRSGIVAKKYSESNPSRFRFISQKNAGVSAARNKGLDLANGKYILFLDSDDFLNPGGGFLSYYHPRKSMN
jgi:glycosyltransferase involved in cell wall biosynthesis